jgi:hypothetical protein
MMLLSTVVPVRSSERPAWVKASKLPLHDAFIAFCANTGAQMDANKATVEAAGGMRRRMESAKKMRGSYDTVVIFGSWDILVAGHDLSVHAMSLVARRAPDMRVTTSCSVDSWDDADAASVAAIRDWAGVPGGGYLDLYSYYLGPDGRHEPLTKELNGFDGLWMLKLMTEEHSASVNLQHYVGRGKQRK